MLCEQPAPHGVFFSALEKLLHEHGPLTLDALLSDLAADAQAEALQPLVARIHATHALDPDPPAYDLAHVLRQIENAELADQLRQITQAATLSDTDRTRMLAIYARQAELRPAPTAA